MDFRKNPGPISRADDPKKSHCYALEMGLISRSGILLAFCICFLSLLLWAEGGEKVQALTSSPSLKSAPKISRKTKREKRNKRGKKTRKRNQNPSPGQMGSKASKETFFQNPLLSKIYGRQARRMQLIDRFKKKGVLGEADSGLLKQRSLKGLKPKEKELLGKLIKAENGDRKRIMAEIIKGGSFTEKDKEEMGRKFFELQQAGDPAGTYFFQADHWRQKE